MNELPDSLALTLAFILGGVLFMLAILYRQAMASKNNAERIEKIEERQNKFKKELNEIPEKVDSKIAHYFREQKEAGDQFQERFEEYLMKLEQRTDKLFEHLGSGN